MEVLVNFPDGRMNLYQIRQWYRPLEVLRERHSVAILCYRPETARQVSEETTVPVVLAPNFTDLSEVAEQLDPGVVLYPNQNYSNYRILGHTRAQHIFICHGESDKIYMASNWVKIFNRFFVAGEASRDRLRRHVRNYDVEARTVEIGRPQIDVHHESPVPPVPGRKTILYAPTWEGGRSTMRYGSVASHGMEIVRSLLAAGEYQVIYRPHPRTGVQLRRTRRLNRRIKRLVNAAAVADPDGGHLVDTTPFGWQTDYADMMITDVSAVAYDWLATGKPLLVTRPVEPRTEVTDTGYLAHVPLLEAGEAAAGGLRADGGEAEDADETARENRLESGEDGGEILGEADDGSLGDPDEDGSTTAGEGSAGTEEAIYQRAVAAASPRVSEIVARTLADPRMRSSQEAWAAYYYGDRTPGSSMRRWIDAVSQALEERDRWVGDVRGAELGVPRGAAGLHRYADTLEGIVARQLDPGRTGAVAETKNAISVARRAEVVVACMGSPAEVDNLLRWLPALERLDRHHSVALVAGDIRTYRLLRAGTGLRVHFVKNAVASEQLTDALHPRMTLQFEQAKLGLREATYRYMSHVYVGQAAREDWINNRLRLFDTVLSPSAAHSEKIAASLMDMPATLTVAEFDDSTEASRLAALRDVLAEAPPLPAAVLA